MILGKKCDRDAADAARILKWDDEATRAPDLYEKKVVAIAAVGYAAPFVAIGALSLMVIGGVAHIIGGGSGAGLMAILSIAGIALVGFIVRSLLVEFEAPSARRLSPEEAPPVFQAIDDVRAALNGPVIDEVYVDDQLNASIQQTPKHGFIGGAVNRLVIGLPLLQALSAQQFKALLAHEYGHLCGAHGKNRAWIYRTRALWAQLSDRLNEHQNRLNAPLLWYLNRLFPFFEKMSFPLARASEFDADKAGADLVGAQITADALARTGVAARYLSEEFWPKVDERARACAAPNVAPLKHSDKAFIRLRSVENAEKWLNEALAEKTIHSDTHPSLSDRIAALGAKPRLAPLKGERATTLLEPLYDEARTSFDRRWRENVKDHWAHAYERAQDRLARLAMLDKAAVRDGLDPDAAFERGDLATEFVSREAGIAAFKQAAIWAPEDARAFLQLGRLLAEERNPRAEKCLRRAASLEPRYLLAASSALYNVYNAQGDHDRADAMMADIRKEEERHAQAEDDIATLSKTEPFKAHNLSVNEQNTIVSALAPIDGVRNIYVVCKSTRIFTNYYGYHVIIAPSQRNFDADAVNAALDEMDFHAPLFSWIATGELKWLIKKAESVDGAKLSLMPSDQKRAA